MLNFQCLPCLMLLILGLTLGPASVCSGDESPQLKNESSVEKTLDGNVVRLLFSPKGPYEGLLLRNGESLFQVSFPKELSAKLQESLKPGQPLVVVGVQDEARGYHLVFKARKFILPAEGEIAVPPKEEKKESPAKLDNLPKEEARGAKVTLAGTVKSLNYAKHGEVNGVVLGDGSFIHLHPHGARILKVAVGQKLSATGEVGELPGGGKVMENPDLVNGKAAPRKTRQAG